MLGASLFIIRCTARNRLRARLRRLREPRYLIGAIVGAVYMYFSVFARFGQRARMRTRSRPAPDAATLLTLSHGGAAAMGLLLMALTAVGWILPFDSGLLEFSKSEIQFLFPAPVSRRELLLHRLLRSQVGMLFGAVIAGIVTPTSGFQRLRFGIAVWLLLSIAKVYFTGVTLARTRLGSRDRAARRVAWLPIGFLVTAFAVVGVALSRSVAQVPIHTPRELLNRLGEMASGGPVSWILWPFVAVVRPMFAAWPGPYLVALAGSGLVLAGCVAWVLASDATFEEATEEIAARKGSDAKARSSYRVGSGGWRLGSTGRPETVFVWKAAMQTMRLVDRRSLLRIVVITFVVAGVAYSVGRRSGFAGMLAAFSMGGFVFAVLLGPQAIRIDMRQDLEHLELLKTWPVQAAAIVRGQMIWPGVLITALAWSTALIAAVFVPAFLPTVGLATQVGVGGAAMVLAPALAFAQLAIHNGAALIFPAWVPLGRQRARGLDAMGQRIIMLGGTWLSLIIMLIPGALAAAIVWFVLRAFIGPLVFIPAALVCTLAVLVEVMVLTELLGPAYERLDLMAVERVE